MTDGLLFVLAEPGRVPEPEFHRWYDRDHGPARLRVPGIRGGERYRAVDAGQPAWLAVYPLELTALDSPQYRALRERSAYEKDLVDRLGVLDRRVYRRVGGDPITGPPAPVLLTVALASTDEPAVAAWYEEEHLPLLHAVPGWLRSTRYRLVEGDAPRMLAVHELSGTGVFDTAAYRTATDTPRRTAVLGTVTARERRLFTHHTTLRPDPA